MKLKGVRRRRNLLLGSLLFAPCLLSGIAFLGTVGSDIYGSSGGLEEEMGAARQMGLPLTPEELRPAVAVATEENAATYLMEAHYLFTALGQSSSNKSAVASSLVAGTKYDEAQLAEVMSKTKDIRALCREAAKRDALQSNLEYSKGILLQYPQAESYRRFISLLAAEAVLKARAGQQGEALAILKDSAKLARMLSEEPNLIFGLVAYHNESQILRALAQTLDTLPKTEENLRSIESVLDTLGGPVKIKQNLRGEVVLSLVSIDQPDQLRTALDVKLPASLMRNGSSLNRASKKRVIEYWRKAWSAYGETDEEIRNGIEKTRALAEEQDERWQPSYILSRVLVPYLDRVAVVDLRNRGNRTCLRAGISILRYKTKHGRLPKTISEVGDFRDPFTGEPIRYRVEDKRFAVYTVDEDKQDDGGEKNVVQMSNRHRDNVFEFVH